MSRDSKCEGVCVCVGFIFGLWVGALIVAFAKG